jgi:carboxyl-terminal processing protease
VQHPAGEQRARTSKKFVPKKLLKSLTLFVGAGAIFMFGWSIGSGRISLHANKPVQSGLPNSLDYSSLNSVYQALKTNYDGKIDTTKLLDGAKQGLAKATGDPYTEYMDAAEYKSFSEDLSGSFTGIGAELSKDNNSIVIVAPLAGYPAEKAGLKPKDVIMEIDGKSAYDLTVSEAVKQIRGPKGTSVKLKVLRNGKDQLTLDIERDNIVIPSVKYKIENGIGYMTISRFGDDTTKLAQEAAQNFKNNHVKGIVLDLRNDPGGLLTSAVDVSSLWLPSGKTVLTERRDGVVVKTYTANGDAILAGIPTVVLINEGSASASEITAGALKDNGVATLIGTKSFGKGSVQQLIQLGNGDVVKVTIARWYTPNGKNIDKAGIEPDQKVTITDDQYKAGQDPQLDTATADLNK